MLNYPHVNGHGVLKFNPALYQQAHHILALALSPLTNMTNGIASFNPANGHISDHARDDFKYNMQLLDHLTPQNPQVIIGFGANGAVDVASLFHLLFDRNYFQSPNLKHMEQIAHYYQQMLDMLHNTPLQHEWLWQIDAYYNQNWQHLFHEKGVFKQHTPNFQYQILKQDPIPYNNYNLAHDDLGVLIYDSYHRHPEDDGFAELWGLNILDQHHQLVNFDWQGFNHALQTDPYYQGLVMWNDQHDPKFQKIWKRYATVKMTKNKQKK